MYAIRLLTPAPAVVSTTPAHELGTLDNIQWYVDLRTSPKASVPVVAAVARALDRWRPSHRFKLLDDVPNMVPPPYRRSYASTAADFTTSSHHHRSTDTGTHTHIHIRRMRSVSTCIVATSFGEHKLAMRIRISGTVKFMAPKRRFWKELQKMKCAF